MFEGAGGDLQPEGRKAPNPLSPMFFIFSAGMAELADALASGASGRKVVGVQLPLSAPNPMIWYGRVTVQGRPSTRTAEVFFFEGELKGARAFKRNRRYV